MACIDNIREFFGGNFLGKFQVPIVFELQQNYKFDFVENWFCAICFLFFLIIMLYY